MNKINHTHQYERSISNEEIYRCVHPRCTHYQRREFLIGKEALCNMCFKPFNMDSDQLRNKKPRCLMCQDTAAGRSFRENMERLSEAIQSEITSEAEGFEPLAPSEDKN